MTSNPSASLPRLALLVGLLGLTAWVAHARGQTPAPRAALLQQGPPRVEVAFVLDTTGSMSGLIEGAKSKIWSIANQLASGQPRPEVRMALVGYRDRGDAYVTRVRDLTGDIDAVYADLQAFQAGGGGDTPESVNQALHEAVTSLSWSDEPGVYRVIFLVGDAPPHLDYAQDVPYAESVRTARQRGIVINTVQCGDYAATTPVWREIASVGGGSFAAIRQDGGMLALATPVDEELAQLGRELSGTLLAWGDRDEQAELEAKAKRGARSAPETAAARLGFLSKLGGVLNAGRADLVDAIASGETTLDEIEEEELPAALQAAPPPERSRLVQEKLEARREIQARIDVLSAERDAYVASERDRRAKAGEDDGFDAKLLETVRDQAAEVGIAY